MDDQGLWTCEVDGTSRPMCCPGCKAVAELICSSGMSHYYTQRTHYAETPSLDQLDEDFNAYDNATVRQGLVAESPLYPDQTETVQLLVSGMTCAACAWLVERRAKQNSAVESARVNLSTASLSLELQPDGSLAEVMKSIAALGYRVEPYQESVYTRDLANTHSHLLKRLAVAGLGMMQVGMFAIALHAGDLQGMEPEYQQLLRWVSLPIAAFVVLYSGGSFFTTAWRHLRHGALVMDLPIALALGLALAASAYATITESGEVYFDSVVMFTFFLLIARYYEHRARYRNNLQLQRLHDRLPLMIDKVADGQCVKVPVSEIRPSDCVRLYPGSMIPIDGVIQSGQTEIQDSAFTGESLPYPVHNGDQVFSGSINLRETIDVLVCNEIGKTRLDALDESLLYAETSKPAIQTVADSIAGRFVAAILLIAGSTSLAWWFIDPSKALWIGLSVLVVSCPCALGLATPAALANASLRLRSLGAIVRGDNTIEGMSSVDTVVFDKTGTLSSGDYTCEEVRPLARYSAAQCFRIAQVLQSFSDHPIARAFSKTAPIDGDSPLLQQLQKALASEQSLIPQTVSGQGLRYKLQDQELRIGQQSFIEELVGVTEWPNEPWHWLGLSYGDQLIALFGLRDELQPDAIQVVNYFKACGLPTVLLTGDNSQQARQIAARLSIDEAHYGLTPNAKLDHVFKLQQEGHRVLMVGDGVNDAPVLAHATVGIAVAQATDLARAKANIVIADQSLQSVISAHQLGLLTRRIIIQNLSWALAYNVLAIPLAVMGLVPPWLAALGMSASSAVVVFNSLRLQTLSLRQR